MAALAAKPACRIIHSAISVPVRPSPARQCTATTGSAATTARKAETTPGGGVVQSGKKRS